MGKFRSLEEVVRASDPGDSAHKEKKPLRTKTRIGKTHTQPHKHHLKHNSMPTTSSHPPQSICKDAIVYIKCVATTPQSTSYGSDEIGW
jgi:hypothetical protein